MFRIFLLTFLGLTGFNVHPAEYIKQIRRDALEHKFSLRGDTLFLKRVTLSDSDGSGGIIKAGDYHSYLLARVAKGEFFRIVGYLGDLPGAVQTDLLVEKYTITYLGVASAFEPNDLPVVISDEENKFKYKE